MASRVLRTAVISPAALAARLAPVADARPSFAGDAGETRVVVADPAVERVKELLGPVVYAEGDETLDQVVHHLLAERGATVAVAESLTGGMIGAALTAMPGSSATFVGGVIAYATRLKNALLGVPAELLAAHGAVHPEVAAAMATGVRERLGASYGLAVTGVAGPEPQDSRPVGTIFIAVSEPDGTVTVHSPAVAGPPERALVRRLTVVNALDLLRRRVLGLDAYRE